MLTTASMLRRMVHTTGGRGLGNAFVDHVKNIGMNAVEESLHNDRMGLWLAKSAVDDPTISIADPVDGFTYNKEGGMTDFNVDLNRKPNGLLREVEGRAQVDPFAIVLDDLNAMDGGMRGLLKSDHPVLSSVANYFLDKGGGGKKVRPAMVLLMARAMAEHHHQCGGGWDEEEAARVYASQNRLAEITELIHTASLLHDDVIDESDTRRGVTSVNSQFGNKGWAVLSVRRDFLLARASVALARLRDVCVVELMSTVIEHLVKGEVMQMKRALALDAEGSARISVIEYYLQKNYYKTGSLMSHSLKSAAVLGGHEEHVQQCAFAYGKHIGLAFQLIDDVLDFEGTAVSLGKPALADLRAGLATAPVLFAQEEHPELSVYITRKFAEEGDVEKTVELVGRSRGLERTKELALSQADLAIAAVRTLQPSMYRDGLEDLAGIIVSRTK